MPSARKSGTERADLAEVVALGEVLLGRFVARGVLVGHEEVAQVDVEIGLGGPDVGEGLEIDLRRGAFVQVGIGGEGEGEFAAGRAGGVEGEFRTVGEGGGGVGAGVELVIAAGVGLEGVEENFGGRVFLELAGRGLGGGDIGLRPRERQPSRS